MISFSDYVRAVAARAGLRVQQQSDFEVTADFDMGDKRTQRVWIGLVGEDSEGNLIISISSPAHRMRPGQKLSLEFANQLLCENASLAHGAWAIRKTKEYDYLVMFDTQIVGSMDPEELRASVVAVAARADQMEKKITGGDVF